MARRGWFGVVVAGAIFPAVLTGCPAGECPVDPAGASNEDCEDNDGDGFCAVCCGTWMPDGTLCRADCDDTDPWVFPGAPELYTDGLDANCDGLDAPPLEVCDNGIDDDGNGVADCADQACYASCQVIRQTACDGALELALGSSTFDFENTLDALSTCGGRERVLRYAAPSAGELAVTLVGATHYVSTIAGCDQAPLCSSVAHGTTSTFVLNPGTTFLVVEDGGSGAGFGLNVAFTPWVCGDGILAGAEQCDDGNLELGDGCDPSCFIESLYGACLAAPELPSGTSRVPSATTNLVDGSCGMFGEPEHFWSFSPPSNGTLHVALESAGGAALYVRDTCTTVPLDLGCAVTDAASPALLHVPAVLGTPLYVFADGASLFDGTAELTVLFTPH